METEGVEEGGKTLHEEKDTDGETGPDRPSDKDAKEVSTLKHKDHDAIPEDFRELGVGKRKSPETEVRSSVGDAPKDVFDGMNGLVDKNFTKVKLSTMSIIMSATAADARRLSLLFVVIIFQDAGAILLGAHLLFVEVAEDEGLGEEHDGDGDGGNDKEDDLNSVLSAVHVVLGIVLPGVKDHGNHEIEKHGR